MSFLEQLLKKKSNLNATDTLITQADGRQYLESSKNRSSGEGPSVRGSVQCGFVIDTAPDKIPAEVIPGLFVGSQDCTDEDVLKSHEIDHILSIGVDTENCPVPHLFVECLDLPETDILPVLKETNACIMEQLKAENRLLVHCNAGVSRAAMVIIGYLISEKGMTFDDAYSLIKSKRSCVQPNPGFVKQLRLLKN